MSDTTTAILAAFVAPTGPAKLTPADFAAAAQLLGCRVSVIRAFAEKESPRSGFDADRRPTILFERHVFRRNTGGMFDKVAPELSNPQPGGYGKESAQYPKLAKAVELNRIGALKACSWGRFQILGENHTLAGFLSVEDMVQAFVTGGEAAHLEAFVRFIRSQPRLHRAVVEGDAKTMARIYNGPNYAANSYDTDLAELIAKYDAEDVAAAKPVQADPPAGKPAKGKPQAVSSAPAVVADPPHAR